MSKSGTVSKFHGPFVFRSTGRSPATVGPIFRTLTTSLVVLALAIPCGLTTIHAQDPPQPGDQTQSDGNSKQPPPGEPSEKTASWKLLPTEDKDLWAASSFGGDGDVTFTPESITMTAGDPITGVRCLAKLPKENFEIELEGRRNNNFDFFCALSFPVGEDGHCSFVVGGWAGAVVGLSSVDGLDAARNSTKKLMHFENGQWYKIRTRVDKESIRCWIDDALVVEQPRAGHKFDIRVEMHESLPLGIAAFMCDSEIRNVRWRQLKEEQ